MLPCVDVYKQHKWEFWFGRFGKGEQARQAHTVLRFNTISGQRGLEAVLIRFWAILRGFVSVYTPFICRVDSMMISMVFYTEHFTGVGALMSEKGFALLAFFRLTQL